MKTYRFLLLVALLFSANLSLAQTLRGRIVTPATPTTNPMDPNGDGFVTTSTSGFSNDGDYIGEFELPMFGIPKVGNGEVDGDNIGNPCGITDLIQDKNGFSVYAFRDANNNLICRFRVGDNNPSVEAWTLLLDVDGLFGPGKDPNATADNPGFELDITLIKRNNVGVVVYNIDGTDNCGALIGNYSISTNFQISLADEVSCGDPDYFYDFYVPFPDVAAAYNASSGSNISASTGLRYVAVTNTSATCAMDGKIADISGVDNDDPLYNNCDVCAFTAIIENQCPTAVNDLCSTCLGFNASLPAKPTINEPIRAGQTVITGTSPAGTYLLLSIYQRVGGTDAAPIWSTTPREEKVVSVPVSAWSITLSSPLLAYDKVVAKSQLTIDGSGCDSSNGNTTSTSVTVVEPNVAPVAQDQAVTVIEDTPKTITVGATDADGNPLTYTILTQPVNGTLTGTAPNLIYTPDLNYNGSDSFTFSASDGVLNSNTATVTITVTPVNDAPVANNQSVTTPEDTPKLIILTASDVENNTLTYSIVGSPAHGTLSGSGANITYTPNANYFGSDTFTFKANDGLDSNIATITITVTAVNDAPVAGNVSVTTPEDVSVIVPLAGTDIENNTLVYTIVTPPSFGTLSGGGSNPTYIPNPNFNGADSFTYKVNDGTTDSNIATASITVTAVNDAPTAINQSVTTPEDTPVGITLTATHPDAGAVVTFSIVSSPQFGTLSGTLPNLTYTPNANFNGQDSFTFQANDGADNSNIATVIINVTPVTDAPIASDLNVTTNEDTPVSFTIVGADPDGSAVTYTIVSQPVNGILTGTAPNLTYTPNANFNGTNTFTFKVNDGTSDSNTATVTITVNPVNDAPVANNQSVTTAEDTPVAITLTGSDVDGNTLTYTVVSAPQFGALSGTAPNLTYTPNANYFGPDSFTFRANDGTVNSNLATVSITVTSVNDGPVANNLNVTTAEDTPVSFAITGTDPEGSALTYTILSQPANGTLTGTAPNLTYTPNANFNGTNTFTFKVNDGTSDSNTATVTITVNPVNDAPVANNQSVTTSEDTPVAITLTGSDVDGNTLTYAVVSAPQFGTLSGTAPNLTYTPNANYFGPDSFTFRANDGTVNSNLATVSITVTSVNDGPVANNLNVTTAEDTPVAITLAGTDPEGNSITYILVSNPANGVLTGTGPNLTYSPNANFNGADSFTYKVNDGSADSNTATVSITVTPVNDAPIANNQTVTAVEEVPLNIVLTGSDIDGDPLTYTVVTVPQFGILTGTGANLTYTSNDFTGAAITDSFTFRVNDGTTNSNLATVFININPDNDAPQAFNRLLIINEDTPVSFTLVGSDPQGDPITYSIVSGPSNGTLSGPLPGLLTYTPNANYNGSDSFTFKVNDGVFDSNIATVTIQIDPVNDAPVASNQSVTVVEDTPKAITLAATDVENDALTYTIIAQPLHGTLSGTGANVTYTPNADYIGSDSFTFRANDGALNSNTATVSINVTPANDAPVAANQTVTTNEDQAVSFTISGTDPDGDALTYIIVSNPSNGTLTGTAPNLTYTPNANFSGADAFTFKVNDGTTDSNIATVSITVIPLNDAPVAFNNTILYESNTLVNFVLTAFDADGDPLTYTVLTLPTNGVIGGTAPNLTYTPNNGFTGSDALTFKVNDGTVDSNIATITFNFDDLSNEAPVAENQSVTVIEDTNKNITLGASDPDGNTLTYTIVTSPTNGTLTGTGANVTYSPNANYTGPDSFTFRVNDGLVNSNIATVSITVTPVNDAPVANNQSVSVQEDVAKAIVLTGSDADGDAITFTIVTAPAHGTLSGTIPNLIYTPAANYNGSDSFTFKVNDGTVDSNIATVSITVVPVNDDAPVASNQSVVTGEDTPVVIILSATDPDGGALTYSIVTGPLNGTLSCTNCANPTYTPALNYNGPDSFTFRANDGTNNSNVATVSITVNPFNDAPQADNQNVIVQEDTPKAITLTASDVDGDPLTFSVVTQPTRGTLSGTAPNLIYTPNTNYTGPDSFTFRANDGSTNAGSKTVSITVVPVNDAPIAINQNLNTSEDTPLLVNLSVTDPDGATPVYTIVSLPANGTLSCTNCANPTYTPNLNYTGTDSFTFKANDGLADSNVGTITITVSPLNDAPVANNQTVIVTEDQAKAFTLTGSDAENAALTFTVLTQPTHGVLSGTAPNLIYTPNANYTGADSFTFKVNDGTTDSNTATISITVVPVNDVPVVTDQSITTAEDVPVAISLTGSDIDLDALTYSIVTAPANGTISGTLPNITYTPNANYNGPDSFTFKANDGTIDSNIATVTITVTPVNDAPVANNQSVSVTEDVAKAIVLTGNDVEGDALTFTILTQPTQGTLSGSGVTVTYTPNANYTGADSFTFKVNDGTTDSNTATVSITVVPVNDTPIVTDQSITTAEDVPVAISLIGSDIDLDALTYSIVTPPTNGTISGTLPNITYTPNANYNGPDSFTFKANDGTIDSNIATVTITVTPVNDAPVADNQSVTVIEDIAKAIVLTGSDVEGDALTFTILTQPTQGTLSGIGFNVTYTPNANYNGPDSFTFKVNDGTTDSNVATVSINVSPVNDAPVANDDAITTLEDLAVAFSITNNDVDIDGTINAATVDLDPSTPAEDKTITVAGQGTYVVDNSGMVVFTPALNYNGTATPVSYTVKDNDGALTNVASIQVIVTPVNDAPVVTPATVTINEDVTSSVCFTVTDVENDPSVFTGAVSLNGKGTLVLDPATGLFCFLYTPNPNVNGQDVVEVTVCDANDPTLCSTGAITINIAPVNDPPIIIVGGNPVDSVFVSTLEDTPVNFCFDATDLEGDAISVGTITNTSGGGTLVNSSSAGNTFCFTYTPTTNFTGSAFWKVQVCDAGNPSLCREVTIEIEVIPTQDPPVAANQNVTVIEDTPKVIVLGATDPDAADVLTYTIVSNPTNGTLTGTGSNVTYTPNLNYYGPDSFTFKANDGTEDSNVATVTIDVTPVNDAPVISTIPVLTVEEDGMLEICLGVTDIDGDGITYNLPTNISGGGTMTPSTQFNFCFLFKPIKDFNGDSFWKFSVCDTGNPSLCAEVEVKIIVTPVNDAPVAVNDFITVQSFVKSDPINIIDNDLDVDNDQLVLTITPMAGPFHGTVTMTADGNIQYQSALGYMGADSVRYKVCDVANPSLCDEGVVFIDVTPAPFKIYNGLSPNGDGLNDHWVIDGIETFPNNKVRVFDRYNNLIFETTGYNNSDNTWQGQTNHSMVKGNVSEGTYFYVVDLGDGSGLYSGYVVLKKD